MAGNFWTVDNDDKYGYKSLLMHICSPDRFPEPDRAGIAIELQGHLKNIDWNDIYNLSKIRKQAKGKLGVDVDVAQLYSHLMEVFSPEKYKKVVAGAERLEQYDEICETLTAAKDDINLLESELYDIAKLDVDLWYEPELEQLASKKEVDSEEIVVEDNLLERDDEMQSEKVGQINDILISLANSLTAKENADDDVLTGEVFNAEDDIKDGKAGNCPVESKVGDKTEPVEQLAPVKDALNNRGMFIRPFSFRGRIRRLEYCLSVLMIFSTIPLIVILIDATYDSDFFVALTIFTFIVVLWFWMAQRTKRCHDMGDSGWVQLIPFYEIELLFGNSEGRTNKYGDCPKKMRKNS